MTVDAFGVPDTLLGPHADDFYGALGRIVCLSALLENRLLTLYEALANAPTDEYKGLQLGDLIRGALKALSKAPAGEARDRLVSYFQRAEPVAVRRNDYAHNLWPAQAGGRLFGWRPDRDKKATPGATVTTSVELADARDLVAQLVDLLVDWPNIFAFVSARGGL